MMERILLHATFWLVVVLTGLIIIFSEMPVGTSALLPLYYHKILGLDILDYLTFALILLAVMHMLVTRKMSITKFHRYLFIILLIYVLALINGFIYGRFLQYPYKKWIQDFQQVAYLFAYFWVVFLVCDTSRRWRLFFGSMIAFALTKNVFILLDFVRGRGIELIKTTTVTAKGADAMLVSIAFFPFLIYLVWGKGSALKKVVYVAAIFVFVFNSLTNVGRTVWLLLMVSLAYLLYEAKFRRGIRILLMSALVIALIFTYLQVRYPRFMSFAQWRLTSIVDLSISQENLSNATRVVEIKNIIHRLLTHASLLQGMGLGAWWDDSYDLLPPGDIASGFVGATQFFHTHLWFLTQLLKIGLVGTLIYWALIVDMMRITRRKSLSLRASNPYKLRLLALNVIFFNLAFCAAGFVRIFTCMGIILALMARGILFADGHED